MDKIEGKICNKCGVPLISEHEKCMTCREKETNYMFNRSVYTYSGAVKEIICQYKFHNKKNLAYFLSETLYKIISENYPEAVIVPVPGRKIIKKQKGWEHIDLICKILKKKYNLPVDNLLLRRGRNAQKSLSLNMRQENLRKNIYIKRLNINQPQKVILVDDIFTTGNTINECAGTLTKWGIKEVYSATIAID